MNRFVLVGKFCQPLPIVCIYTGDFGVQSFGFGLFRLDNPLLFFKLVAQLTFKLTTRFFLSIAEAIVWGVALGLLLRVGRLFLRILRNVNVLGLSRFIRTDACRVFGVQELLDVTDVLL